MSERIKVEVDREIQDLVPTFLSNRQRDLVTLRNALANQDYDAIRIIGHNLKGVGGGYGFHEITNIGMQMEKAAKEAQTDTLNELVVRYAEYLDLVDVEFV